MSINLHLFLRSFISAIFFIGVFVIIYFLVMVEEKPVVGYISAFISFCSGIFVPDLVFKYVPAACPKCEGRSYAILSPAKRLCFECTKCGYVHKTRIVETDDMPSD